MFLPEQLKIKCQLHSDANVSGICFSQKCTEEQKCCCFKCMCENKHHYCEKISIENIPEQVENHSKRFQKSYTTLKELEKAFFTKIQMIKTVLEGYQVDETFKFISELEDLNSLIKKLTTLPKLDNKINEISQAIHKELEELSIKKIQKLCKYQTSDLGITILQRERTNTLMQTIKIQQNESLQVTTTGSTQENTKNEVMELLEQGEQNQKSKQYILAIKCFEKILELQPQNIQAKSSLSKQILKLVNTLKQMNQFNSYFVFKINIQQKYPEDFDAALEKGQILYDQQQYKEAIEYVLQQLNNFSDKKQQTLLLKLLCNNYLEDKQIVNARNILINLRESQEITFDFQQILAKYYLLGGFLEEAEKYLKTASENNNNDFQNIIIQIQIFQKKQQYKKGLDLINQYLHRNIQNKDKQKLMKLKTSILFDQKQFQEAMISCYQFLEDYNDLDILQIFGKCFMEINYYHFATHLFEKILSQQQNHSEAQQERSIFIQLLVRAQQNLNLIQQNQQANQLNQLSVTGFRRKLLQNNSQILPTQGQGYTKYLYKAGNFKFMLLVEIMIEISYPQADNFIDECIRNFTLDEQFLVLKARYYLKNFNTMPEYRIKIAKDLRGALIMNPNNREAIGLLDSLRPQTSVRKGQFYH